MKTFRIALGILAIIPLALLMDHILIAPISYDPNSLREMAFMVFGVPILTLNYWAWGYPDIIEIYFRGNKGKDEETWPGSCSHTSGTCV